MAGYPEFLQMASSGNVVPVVETMPADLLTPLGVYLSLAADSDESFLLESVEGGASLARYSFIGAGPDFVASGDGTGVTIRKPDGSVDRSYSNVVEFLRAHFEGYRAVFGADLPAFIGGAIGYLDFDSCDIFEPSLRSSTKRPDHSLLMFFRSIVAFDHARQQVRIVTLVFLEGKENHSDLYDAAVARNRELRSLLESGHPVLPKRGSIQTARDSTSNWTRAEFESAVERVKELIRAGECYQVVLSQCFSRPTDASGLSIYRALRSINPSPYMFLIQSGEKSVVGSSPEMLVRCADRRLDYRAIAGTRPRGETELEDVGLADEMRADPKEVAEHLMLVDLGRNDLGRVAEFGSVTIDELMKVEKYSHVQHLVSSLSATLRSDLDCFDALAACFPAGTVSGAPKVRAIEIIRDFEPTQRGLYAGAVGYFDYSGNMDTCIAIRTLVLENGVAKIHAGAGIVADSVPSLEFEETVNKARVLLKAISIAESGAV